jgi:hypothetical protein
VQVAERIDELASRLNVQEMAVVTWATDEAARRRSYELLAQAMGFAPPARLPQVPSGLARGAG